MKLAIKGGKGGNGVISFFTDKRVRRGAPYGGDGGSGGHVIIQAHSSMHDLSHLRLKTIEGVDGQNGGTFMITQELTEEWVKVEGKLYLEYPQAPSFISSHFSKKKKVGI